MRLVRAVCLLQLICLKFLAASDFKIGPDVPLDSLSIASTSNNYMVVWRDLRNSSAPQMRGAFVSTTGVVSADFGISDASGQPLAIPVQRSTTVFDGTNFFSVWADNRSGGAGIRGALISTAGTVVGGADLLIAPLAQNSNANPLVVFTGAEYVVAWQDAAQSSNSAGPQIYFTRVGLNGAAGAVQSLPQSPFSSSTSLSLEFLVVGTGEVLLVYQDLAATPAVTLATRVASDNTLIRPSTLLFKRDFSSTGFGVPIGAAFDGAQYMILSSFSAQIDSTVWLTRLLNDGSVFRPSTGFAEVGQGTTGVAEDAFPRVVYNGVNEFLFIRNDFASATALHIFAERVSVQSINRDPNPFVVDSASQGILNGGVAASIGATYLIVWMDGRRLAPQPAGQGNVFGAFLDDVQNPGDQTVPFLRAVAHAGPIIGDPPLTVQFNAGGSTGIADTVQWNFADGATATTSDVSHVYQNAGEYVAVLTLNRAGFGVRDFVRILCGGNLLGGNGGAPQSLGGVLGPVSNGVNTDVLANALTVNINFGKTATDTLHFTGFIDPAMLPVSTAHQTAALTIAGKSYSVSSDATGAFQIVTGKPNVNFQLNNSSGAFAFNTNSDDLAAAFAALGAANTTVAKPGNDVIVPVSFSYAGVLFKGNITAKYIAQAEKAGRLAYVFGSSGSTDNGFMHIFGAAAAESGTQPSRVHAFAVSGNFGPGSNAAIVKAASGNWQFTLGNYVESIPVSSLTIGSKSTVYAFKAPKGKVGITSLGYDTSSGRFLIEYKLVPAEGNTPSGMALSSANIARADMAFSVDLATASGIDFQAAATVRFIRSKAGSKKWKMR